MDYLVVIAATLFIGGFSIPIGLLLGLSPLAVYVTATLAALGYAAAVLGAGGPVRDWVMRRFAHNDDESSDDGKAGRLVDRWGVPGLAGIGSVVLGPTITLLAALTLGVDLKKFGLWYGAATIVIFAVLTLFWDLVLSVD